MSFQVMRKNSYEIETCTSSTFIFLSGDHFLHEKTVTISDCRYLWCFCANLEYYS